MSEQQPSPKKVTTARRGVVGALLCTAMLAPAGCGVVGGFIDGTGTDRQSQNRRAKSAEQCDDSYNPDKVKGGFAIRAAEHNNRITDCVLIPAKVNLSAVHELNLEAKQAYSRSSPGNYPSATGILRAHYKTDFGLSDAADPETARNSLVDGGSFRDLTRHIDPDDLAYTPGGLFVLGIDKSGDLDISISLGSNSQPNNKEHNGRSGLLNSDGLTDSKLPIDDGRLEYVLGPVGKSRPNG